MHGLTDSATFAFGSTDHICFYAGPGDTTWTCRSANDATFEETVTAVPVDNQFQHFRIEIVGANWNGGFRTNFYIDRVLVATHTDAASLPNSANVAYGAYVQSAAATSSGELNLGNITYMWNVFKY